MAQVFKKQSNLIISLDTGTDMSAATEKKILYRKPNGTTGEWVATSAGTILSYQLTDTSIDRDGTWSFQAYAIIAGKKYYGEITQKVFLNPLN